MTEGSPAENNSQVGKEPWIWGKQTFATPDETPKPIVSNQLSNLPDWYHKALARPETQQEGLSVAKNQPATFVQEESGFLYGALYGEWVHYLLMALPPYEEKLWKEKAMRASGWYALPKDICQRGIQEAIQTLKMFPWLLEKEALREANLGQLGEVENQELKEKRLDFLSLGQPMRLIDFKTGKRTDERFLGYQQQMRSYRAALAVIYPKRTLETYLLWTREGKMEKVF